MTLLVNEGSDSVFNTWYHTSWWLVNSYSWHHTSIIIAAICFIMWWGSFSRTADISTSINVSTTMYMRGKTSTNVNAIHTNTVYPFYDYFRGSGIFATFVD